MILCHDDPANKDFNVSNYVMSLLIYADDEPPPAHRGGDRARGPLREAPQPRHLGAVQRPRALIQREDAAVDHRLQPRVVLLRADSQAPEGSGIGGEQPTRRGYA